jgi:hypothetical protein
MAASYQTTMQQEIRVLAGARALIDRYSKKLEQMNIVFYPNTIQFNSISRQNAKGK